MGPRFKDGSELRDSCQCLRCDDERPQRLALRGYERAR